MAEKLYLSAAQAAAELEISMPTLYAYVSRGLIRSEPGNGKKRVRRYPAEDIERLKARNERRRDPNKALQGALHWGEPILESAITRISDGKLYYRGKNALALAEAHTFEQVTGLLWEGELSDQAWQKTEGWRPAGTTLPSGAEFTTNEGWPIQAFQELLARTEAKDSGAYDLRAGAVALCGARILRALAFACGADMNRRAVPMATALQAAWAADHAEAAPVLGGALILCADHELNISSFTARCVASAASTPYSVVIAGLSALQGYRHGGGLLRVEALFEEVREPGRAVQVLSERLRRGERLSGFGHLLYPQGDPRAKLLIESANRAGADPREMALAEAIFSAAAGLTGEQPNLDAGLTVLRRALHLPQKAGLALFALGRTAGWIAHAIEQYSTGELIRPRALYTGPAPEE